MSGWTTSYRWEGRTRAKVGGLLRHNARDVDLRNGLEVEHSNDDIDPGRTDLNVTMVNDGTGQFVPMQRVEQAMAFLDKRIEETGNTRTLKDGRKVKVGVRKDAAVATEFILQLDPEFTGNCADMDDDEVAETKELLGVMIDEVVEQMGAENVITWSEHWDEGRPHVQLLAVPVTDDGDLSMKKKLGGRSKAEAQRRYSEMHDSMRSRLRAAGYDATDERVDAGKRHLGLEGFKKQRDKEEELYSRGVDAKTREVELNVREKGLDKREEALAARERAVEGLEGREMALRRRTRAVERREADVGAREHAAQEKAQKAAQKAAQAQSAQKLAQQQATFHENMALANGQLKMKYLDHLRRMEPIIKSWEQRNPNTEKGQRVHKAAKTHAQLVREIEAAAREIEDRSKGDDQDQLGG